MVLQEKIPIPPSEATASFDYADIQEGSGKTIYNLANGEISGNVKNYFLTTNSNLYSQDPDISGNASAGIASDLDYDITFNRPQNLKGIAYASIPFFGGDDTTWLRLILRHWDGTTETQIATAESKVAVSNKKFVANIPLNIATVRHFKKGETLRLTVQVLHSGIAGNYGYGSDPADRVASEVWIKSGSINLPTARSFIVIPFILKT